MALRFQVELGDALLVHGDLLVLKHAAGFYGVDRCVVDKLLEAGDQPSCEEFTLKPGQSLIVRGKKVSKCQHIMFLGTVALPKFGYEEMQEFARQSIFHLQEQLPGTRTIVTTIHGAGYGLDPTESLFHLAKGFAEGVASTGIGVEQITFAETNARRAASLKEKINDGLLESLNFATHSRTAALKVEIVQKPHVFVAMPFSDDFEDVWQFGIYEPIRRCGLICEKTNEAAFTGDILTRIKTRIETAGLVIAEMTGARPNVYLEVGYAWGKGVDVIFLARHGEQLHFDITRHRCIYYRNIIGLATELEGLVRRLPIGQYATGV